MPRTSIWCRNALGVNLGRPINRRLAEDELIIVMRDRLSRLIAHGRGSRIPDRLILELVPELGIYDEVRELEKAGRELLETEENSGNTSAPGDGLGEWSMTTPLLDQ